MEINNITYIKNKTLIEMYKKNNKFMNFWFKIFFFVKLFCIIIIIVFIKNCYLNLKCIL